MISKVTVALLATALATAALASTTSAAPKHPAKHVATPAQAETIAGVNPMTNAPPSAPVAHPQPFVRIYGPNPM